MKYGVFAVLRIPELRTDDLEVIKTDVDNVKWYPLKKFRPLLEKNWEVKADLLLEMVTTEGFGFKKNIYKESKRLTRIALDLFSDEQERAILKWKRTFIGKKVEEGKFGDYATVKNVVEETVVPWIAPFMYSRITRQDEVRNLSLEVALHDFCKMSNVSSLMLIITYLCISFLISIFTIHSVIYHVIYWFQGLADVTSRPIEWITPGLLQSDPDTYNQPQ